MRILETCLSVGLLALAAGCSDSSTQTSGQTASTSTRTAASVATKPEAIEPERLSAAMPARLQGVIENQAFSADQVLLEDGVLTLRQGEDFFADRSVVLFLFDDQLDNRAFDVTPETGFDSPHLHLAYRPAGRDMPSTHVMTQGYHMQLQFGETDGLSIPITLSLLAEHDGLRTEIRGQQLATLGDIRLLKGEIDPHYNSLDTVRLLAETYLNETYPESDWGEAFGVSYSSDGDQPVGRGFVGFPKQQGDQGPDVARLMLTRDDLGWAVSRELGPHELIQSHAFTGLSQARSIAKDQARVVASRVLERKLAARDLDLGVAHDSCRITRDRERASCRFVYGIRSDAGTACEVSNYLLVSRESNWEVLREIGPEERVNASTGELEDFRPFDAGCV